MAESPTIVAGAIAGAAALLVFVVVHAIWIVPIWGMLLMLPLASAVGAIAAWPFAEMASRGTLPAAPYDGIAFSLILLATLIPTALYGAFAGPVDMHDIDVRALVVPLLLAAPSGAAIGLLFGGSERSALALASAALALALTLGHNLPFFPLGSASWEKAFSLVVAAEVSAGIAFGAARALVGSAATVPAP